MTPDLAAKSNALVISYTTVRRAIGISGFFLPPALLLGGWLAGVPVQDNMSSYYHTPMRDIFVGTLCTIGIFLFCYRGFDWVENWTANIGCAAALGVALFPLDYNSDPLLQRSVAGYIHTFSGGAFFLTLAFYSLFHFPLGAKREQEPHLCERNLIYRTSGIVILLCLLIMGSYLFLASATWKQILNRYNFLFWLEWVAVWSFASAWLAKGRTIFADIAINMLAVISQLMLVRDGEAEEEQAPPYTLAAEQAPHHEENLRLLRKHGQSR